MNSRIVRVQLNARLQPVDRADLFEDPLMEDLEEAGIGSVSGGGTMMAEEGEVAYCDIEIEMQKTDDEKLRFIIQQLESLGAPKGSQLHLADNQVIPFGQCEGLAIYLNGTDLPDEVYETCDPNTVYSEISQRINDEGMIMSHWQGPTETAFYLYGNSFVTMNSLIEEFVNTYPLCQKCRIVQIA
jgi:hypothetical protein